MPPATEPQPVAGRAGVSGPGLVNAANALTIVRLALVPVFVACLVTGGPGWRVAACAAFGVASATDLLDGRIARRRGGHPRHRHRLRGARHPSAPPPGRARDRAVTARPAGRELAGEIIAVAARQGLTIAVAESLTGGLLAAALTAVPGASEVFRGG